GTGADLDHAKLTTRRPRLTPIFDISRKYVRINKIRAYAQDTTEHSRRGGEGHPAPIFGRRPVQHSAASLFYERVSEMSRRRQHLDRPARQHTASQRAAEYVTPHQYCRQHFGTLASGTPAASTHAAESS